MTSLDRMKSTLRQLHAEAPRKGSRGTGVDWQFVAVVVFAAVLYGMLVGGLR